jgi:hypothetical protein
VHVGKETRRQCRRRQQSDRNNAFRGHQFKCAARAAIRAFRSIGAEGPGLSREKFKVFLGNLRRPSVHQATRMNLPTTKTPHLSRQIFPAF